MDRVNNAMSESENATSSSEHTRCAEPTEGGAEELTLSSAQNIINSSPPTSRDWILYKQELEKINVAIERATNVSEDEGEESQDISSTQKDITFINVSFKEGVYYRLPWDACCTWKRMETFLRTWFEDDEYGSTDLERGTYVLKTIAGEVILPQVWARVLTQNVFITYSRSAPSAPSTRPASPVNASEIPQPRYETRIRYSIKYMRRRVYSEGYETESDCDSDNSFDEPVGFEVIDTQEGFPALEEVQEIVAPLFALPRRKGKKDRTRVHERRERRVKLRPYDRLGTTRLKINSPFLLNIIRSVVVASSKSPGSDEGLTDGVFDYPYKDLYLNFAAVKNYQQPTNPLRMRHSDMFNLRFDEHLRLLTEYLEGPRGIPLETIKSNWANKKPTTSFAAIWLLLKPGSDVYARQNDGSLDAYIVESVDGGVSFKEGRKKTSAYYVKIWNLVYGGGTIHPRTHTIEINVFDNSREISSLAVFPVRFKDEVDGGALKKKLIERGRKYFEYSKRPKFLQYSGNGLKEGKSYNRARVVVEHVSRPWEEDEDFLDSLHCPEEDDEFGLLRRVARCECQECQGAAVVEDVHAMPLSDYSNIDPRQSGELTSHQYMLMTSHMFAFILKDRKYDLLDVDLLDVAEMAESAIDKLVMDAGNKDIIKAIAKIYTHSDPAQIPVEKMSSDPGSSKPVKIQRFSADFISGKGEGQIILLHGPPGTGKTLTAESVAEYTKRPLLSITAADLGPEPEALEKRLLKYFRRATDWDAIVLLDEADVYLEQRSADDLRRNSIVSVFLRAMDYFQGILFLTTNRVGHFDEAFRSRIHLSLGYKTLDDKARAQIWDNLFQKLTEDYLKGAGPKIEFGMSAKEYVKLARVMALQWNGREIRNAFQTAVALAVYDANYRNGGTTPYLSENHLEQVVAMSTAFKTYMEDTHQGMTDSELASYKGIRSDSPADQLRGTRGNRTAQGLATLSGRGVLDIAAEASLRR